MQGPVARNRQNRGVEKGLPISDRGDVSRTAR